MIAAYTPAQAIESSKAQLKGKMDEAKRLGEGVNAARADIQKVKSQIEAVRRERAAAEVAAGGDGGNGAEGSSTEEEKLKARMEDGKMRYKELASNLLGTFV